MRTHPESIWLSIGDMSVARAENYPYGYVTYDGPSTSPHSSEFVPAAAYLELREFVERVANDGYCDHGSRMMFDAKALIAKVMG